MTADAVLYDLDSLYLEIDPGQQALAWQQSRALSNPVSRWRAYLNQLGLTALLAWLKAEGLKAKPTLANALQPTVWELVTGSALDCQGARLIVLLTESLDSDELRVPQSWVDIPSWVGDYYLSLQVNVDAGWVRFAGFTTHQRLKECGEYDWRDRTYSLEESAVTPHVSVLQIAQDLYPEAIKREMLTALPTLSVTQAHQLIERLAAPSLLEPRLAIGFEQWGALLNHGGWRRQLAERRWGKSTLPLRQWLQSGINQLTDSLANQMLPQLGWQQLSYQPAMALARGAKETTETAKQQGICRNLDIEGETYSLQVTPLTVADNAWRFELTKAVGLVSAGVALKLLTEDLQPFENNQAVATEAVDSLYVDVAVADQEGLVWQVHPVPSQYDPEILRF
ncbi:MAG: DUF1822 family protein [Phormidesmis sp.]